MLENSYFCSIANNRPLWGEKWTKVVICLKTRTFAVSQTTTPHCDTSHPRLWFAWKLVLLQYRKQPRQVPHYYCTGCDLLENSYFCSIANNLSLRYSRTTIVVICLKTRTFAVSQTTGWHDRGGQVSLWFAWKLVLLQYRKQHALKIRLSFSRCDLLENSYFCSIANNSRLTGYSNWIVVICLKTRTFAVSQTTSPRAKLHGLPLWFAWKLVLLQYRKQHRGAEWAESLGCDLLENSYFCSIANN